MSDSEERALLEACRGGDHDALRRLVDAHYDPLYRFLWRLTGSTDWAAELTQETFVRALERLGAFSGRARFTTWLHAIALNLWRDTGRRAPRETSAPLDPEREAAAQTGGEQEALARLERHEVRRAVDRLPEVQRVAILLFYYQGMSYQEIATLCRASTGTVGSWIHHGVRALRRMLVEPEGCERDRGRTRGCPRRTTSLEETA